MTHGNDSFLRHVDLTRLGALSKEIAAKTLVDFAYVVATGETKPGQTLLQRLGEIIWAAGRDHMLPADLKRAAVALADVSGDDITRTLIDLAHVVALGETKPGQTLQQRLCEIIRNATAHDVLELATVARALYREYARGRCWIDPRGTQVSPE